MSAKSYDFHNFEQGVLLASGEVPVLCDFWAPWCGPCRMLGPVLEKLVGEADGKWRLAKVNVDEYPEVSQRYSVRGIPAVKLFHHGKVVAEFSGALPEPALRQWLQQHLPNPGGDLLQKAEKALAELRFAEAVACLKDFPENSEDATYRLLLAKALLWSQPNRSLALAGGLARDSERGREWEAVQYLASYLAGTAPAVDAQGPMVTEYRKALSALRHANLETAMQILSGILNEEPRFGDGEALRLQRALIMYLGLRHPLSDRHYRIYSSAASL